MNDKEKAADALFKSKVISIIRRCFLVYSPIILVIISSMAWYSEGIRTNIKDISTSQIDITRSVSRQEVQINSINENFNKLDGRFNKLQDRIYGAR